jgi:hypothetical protein
MLSYLKTSEISIPLSKTCSNYTIKNEKSCSSSLEKHY